MYQLPPLPTKKKPKPPHQKSEAIRELERLYMVDHRRRYPSMPEAARTCKKYRDNSANGLTGCVIDWIRLNGGQAERINCTGRYVDNTQVFTDVVGRTRSIGTGQWLPSSGTKGTADISAVIRGRAVKIEIKYGRDRQSDDQRNYQAQIETAGGIYLIVRTFAQFYDWYNEFIAVRTAPQNISEHIEIQDVKSGSVPYMYKNGL